MFKVGFRSGRVEAAAFRASGAGPRANCHPGRASVPGVGRKVKEGEEETAVSRSWAIKGIGIYAGALPSLHPEPSSQVTPAMFLLRGSSGPSGHRPTHAWVRVPVTHITGLPGRNEEAGLLSGRGRALVQGLLTRSVQEEEGPEAVATLFSGTIPLSLHLEKSLALPECHHRTSHVSIRAAVSPELPGLRSSVPSRPGVGKEELGPWRVCRALGQQICSSFPCSRSGGRW